MSDASERARTVVSNSGQPLQPDYKTRAANRANPAASKAAMRVTVDNFRRAETDTYFGRIAADGGFGKLYHHREPMPVETPAFARPNRDTLFSSAVFDLDAAPVTIWMPDSRGRFMSLMALDENQYVVCVGYDRGEYTFSRASVGTRYVMITIRTFADPSNRDDLREAHELQDSIGVNQTHRGRFVIPNWELESQRNVREALVALGGTLPDMTRMFGSREQVDPVRHLIGSAMMWGANPERDAVYVSVTPPKNEGRTVYRLRASNVPVDAFWSISVYNADGYFEPNDRNAYSVNNITAVKARDGSVSVQFGGCDGTVANCLPIFAGWNYLVRLYRPRSEILDGSWRFPQAQPVSLPE
jgi:hypothetical protein